MVSACSEQIDLVSVGLVARARLPGNVEFDRLGDDQPLGLQRERYERFERLHRWGRCLRGDGSVGRLPPPAATRDRATVLGAVGDACCGGLDDPLSATKASASIRSAGSDRGCAVGIARPAAGPAAACSLLPWLSAESSRLRQGV